MTSVNTATTNGDSEDHGRAASPPSLVVIVDHQGSHSRLALPPSLSPHSLSTEELRTRIGRRLSLSRHEAFDIEWVDDDNNVSYISDDESLREALDFFTPSSAAVSSPTSSSFSSSSSPAPVELQVRIRFCTRISLSDSSGPSEVGKRASSSSSASGSSAASSSSWWQTDEDEEEASSSQNGSSRSNGHSSGETWEYVRRAGDQTRTTSKSSATSSRLPPLNGRQRMAAYPRRDAENDADSDDEEGTEYAYSVESSVPASLARCNSGSTTAVHRGIRCVACDTTPIRGPRYLCLVCPDGVSFCARCEDVGRAIQHGPHLATHALVKLVEAGTMTGAGSSSSSSMGASHEDIASTLIRAAQQLTIGRSGTSAANPVALSSSSSTRQPPPSLSLLPQPPPPPSPLAHDVLCSFCSEPIVGARFLCANCPLDLPTPEDSPATTPNGEGDGEQDGTPSPTPPQTVILTPHEGFNLCSSCEQHSLSIHDADHFFIRIPSPAALVGGGDGSGRSAPLPLRLNPYLTIRHRTEGLLPTLYRGDDLGWEEMKRAMKTEQGGSGVGAGMLAKVTSSSYADNAAIALGLAQAAQLGTGSSSSNNNATAVAPRSRFFSRWCPTATTPTTSTPPATANLDERTYVSSLVHPNIFCDVCFNVVEGFWMRCTSCPVSYDVCQDCATRGAVYEQHDRSHAFAVFKRAVDLDLFRSLVDHFGLPEGMADGPEPSHAMLPFPLV